MTPTVEQLKQAIANVLERHGDDLIAATRAGRIFALLGASDVEPDGGFSWKVMTSDLAEVVSTIPNGAALEKMYTEARGKNRCPVLIIGSDSWTMIGFSHAEGMD